MQVNYSKKRMMIMKLKSLKNALKDLNLEITEFPEGSQREHLYRIHLIDIPSKVVATISQNTPLRFSTNHQLFETFSHKETLLDLILKFASTPINERDDGIIYELRMDGLHEERNVLTYTKKATSRRNQGEYFFGCHQISNDNPYYQVTFTERELEHLPQVFKEMVVHGHIEMIPQKQ